MYVVRSLTTLSVSVGAGAAVKPPTQAANRPSAAKRVHLFIASPLLRAKLLAHFGDADIAKQQIGCRVVPLQADVALLQSAAVASVVLQRAVVGPIDHGNAVHPGRDVPPLSDDG